MNYTIYNSFGQITKLVDTLNIELQLSDGEQYLEGHIDGQSFYIENGVPAKLPDFDEQRYFFDYETKTVCRLYTDEQEAANLISSIRSERARRISYSDWTQLPDVPEATRLKWQAYRQALRDITLQDGFPQNIIWPEMPE